MPQGKGCLALPHVICRMPISPRLKLYGSLHGHRTPRSEHTAGPATIADTNIRSYKGIMMATIAMLLLMLMITAARLRASPDLQPMRMRHQKMPGLRVDKPRSPGSLDRQVPVSHLSRRR
jgi:hypothetical protein